VIFHRFIGCSMEASMQPKTELATLGGGCFWCLEPVFRRLKGVENVTVGYAGGQTLNPTYKAVCTGTTGHAEVVQVEFNPDEIPFKQILRVFFSVHDPTTRNRQGADVGTQYRSIILTHSEEQAAAARALMADLDASGLWPNPIVTQVEPLQTFFPAEDYHQQYFEKNPYAGYCQMVIHPKVEKFIDRYADLLKQAD
jgi:peptide-methionine (S)-S-oxide reductase